MKNYLCCMMFGWIAALVPAALARAGPEECRQAMEQYIVIASTVTDALASYEMCVMNSLGQDDCSLEFSRLQAAQSDFEAAVDAYQNEC
jgi:hypothetical protein